MLSVEGLAPDGGEAGVEGRAVIGRGPNYVNIAEAPDTLFARLEGSMAERRATAWRIAEAMLAPQDVTINNITYQVPMWHTWYEGRGANPEVGNLFTDYVGAFRACRENPQCTDTPADIASRVVDESGDKDLVRSLTNANLENVLPQAEGEQENGAPEEALAQGVTLFSPRFVEHILANAQGIDQCPNSAANHRRWNEPAPSPTNFSHCIPEFPRDAVMVKTNWEPVDQNNEIPFGDFDASTINGIMDSGQWPARTTHAVSSDNIYMVRTAEGQNHALTAIHFSTKDTREWMWVSLWWSPNPNQDFGEDRPASFARYNGGVWANYKMCVTSSFEEGDGDPGASFAQNQPSLARMVRDFDGALERQANGGRTTTWCSNPNVENQHGNARTNCIGCHQYAYTWNERENRMMGFRDTIDYPSPFSPTRFDQRLPNDYPQFGRERRRANFAADFSWAFAGEFRRNIVDARRANGNFQW